MFPDYDYSESPKRLNIAITQTNTRRYIGIIYDPETPRDNDELNKRMWQWFDDFFLPNIQKNPGNRKTKENEQDSYKQGKTNGLISLIKSTLQNRKKKSRAVLPGYTPDFINPFEEIPNFNDPRTRALEEHTNNRPSTYHFIPINTECGPIDLLCELHEHFKIQFSNKSLMYKIAQFSASEKQVRKILNFFKQKPFHYLYSPTKKEWKTFYQPDSKEESESDNDSGEDYR